MAIAYSASHGSNNGGAVALGTIDLTFTGSLASGAGIALAIGHYRNTVTSVTDNVSNNYWQVFTMLSTITGKADNGIDVWVSDAANGQPTTITANYSATNTLGRMICAASFTGVDFLEATGYDQRQTNEQESVIPWTSNTFTPTAGERLLLGAAKEGSGADNTSTPDAPWQELFDFGCGTGDSIVFQYQIVTADGSTAYAATGNWIGTVGVYAAGGASLFGAATAQRLSPSADSVDGSWTDNSGGTALAAAIDETTASDTDYIRSPLGPSNAACRVKFASGSDPASSSGHIIHWRVGKDITGGATIGVTVKLYQGGGDSLGAGTLIASFTRSNVDALTTYDETLSSGEADSITNYGDLYGEFSANQT